jgi:hypothetical protein
LVFMSSKNYQSLKHLSLSLAFALSACGGGGGDSSNTASPLSSTQAQGAAKSANSADWIMTSVEAIQYEGFSYLGRISTALAGTNTTSTDLGTVCTSGSYAATWSVGSAASFSVGDTITLTLTNCVKSDGYTYNGSETYTINSVSSGQVTSSSSVNNLTVSTINNLSHLSFSNSHLSYNKTITIGTTYPKTFKSTGGVTAVLTTTAGNIASGTYTISNSTLTDTWRAVDSHALTDSLTSSDGTYNNIELTNLRPKVRKSFLADGSGSYYTETFPKYLIKYSAASINVDVVDAYTSTLSGTNADGSIISNTSIGYAYFD